MTEDRYHSSSSTQSSIRLLTHVHLMFGPAMSAILLAAASLRIYDDDFRRVGGCLASAFFDSPVYLLESVFFLAPGLRLSLQFLFVGMALRLASNPDPGDAYNTSPCRMHLMGPPDLMSPRLGKYSVRLTWNASASLSASLARDDGYNLYRLNPGGSCVLLNRYPIQGTVFDDDLVKSGTTYRYTATAVKHFR